MMVYLVRELSVGRIRVRPLVVKDATSLTFLRKVTILVALLVSLGVIFDSSVLTFPLSLPPGNLLSPKHVKLSASHHQAAVILV